MLEGITQEHIEKTKMCVASNLCECLLVENKPNLYIVAKVTAGVHCVEVTIVDKHTNITKIVKDGEIIFEYTAETEKLEEGIDCSKLTVKDILTFANEVKIEDIEEIIGRQVKMNSAIAQEGLDNNYGAQIGKTMMQTRGKIASSVDAALMAFNLSVRNKSFLPGEGIIKGDVEETIKSMGYIGRVGMKMTDTEILNIMIDRVDVNRDC